MAAPTLPDKKLTLLTGATGALGQETLYQWLETHSGDGRMVVLARGGKREGDANRRIRTILSKRFGKQAAEQISQHLTVLDGDVTEPCLGLEPRLYAELAVRLDQIIHCAAAVRFDQPLEQARQINLDGTRHTLELAYAARKAGQRGRYDYIGTAYIAGKRHGVATEGELEHSKGFHNTYEQSKYEAEILVRRYMAEMPVAIHRPSIIIGNSKTGETANFKAFYWPIRAYASGQLKTIPASSACRVDLVPVDYVAAAVIHLSRLDSAIGQTYHLTAGRSNLITVREIAEASIAFFGLKPPFMVHPRYFSLLQGSLGKKLLGERNHRTLLLGQPYYPYLGMKLEFDNSQAAKTLADAGIFAPHVRDFFDRLFRYCVETDWGRHAPDGTRRKSEAVELEPEESIISLAERPSLA